MTKTNDNKPVVEKKSVTSVPTKIPTKVKASKSANNSVDYAKKSQLLIVAIITIVVTVFLVYFFLDVRGDKWQQAYDMSETLRKRISMIEQRQSSFIKNDENYSSAIDDIEQRIASLEDVKQLPQELLDLRLLEAKPNTITKPIEQPKPPSQTISNLQELRPILRELLAFQLERRLYRHSAYTNILIMLEKHAHGLLSDRELALLEKFSTSGLPTIAQLATDWQLVRNNIQVIASNDDLRPSFTTRLSSWFKQFVEVRHRHGRRLLDDGTLFTRLKIIDEEFKLLNNTSNKKQDYFKKLQRIHAMLPSIGYRIETEGLTQKLDDILLIGRLKDDLISRVATSGKF